MLLQVQRREFQIGIRAFVITSLEFNSEQEI